LPGRLHNTAQVNNQRWATHIYTQICQLWWHDA